MREPHPLSELVCMTCWPRYTSNSRRRYIFDPPPLSATPTDKNVQRRTMSLRCQSSATLSGAGPKISDRRSTGPLSCWSRRRRKHRSLPGRRRTKYICAKLIALYSLSCGCKCIHRKRLSFIAVGFRGGRERAIPEILGGPWSDCCCM